MRRRGFDAWGFDKSDIAGSGQAHEYVIYGTSVAELAQDFRNSIEVILLLDVLEHVESPEAFIHTIARHFCNLRYVLVTLAACQDLWTGYDQYYGPYKRYNLPEARAIFDDVRWNIIDSRYLFHLLYPGLKLFIAMGMRRSLTGTVPCGIMRIIHSLLALYFFLEARIVPGSWYGTSILLVAEEVSAKRQ